MRAASTGRTICIFFPTIEAGGMEKALSRIAELLMERGYRVILFYASCQEKTWKALPEGLVKRRAARPARIPLFNRRVWEALSLLPAWNAFLRSERPDCVLSFQSSAAAIPIARLAGIPVIHRESADCRAALKTNPGFLLKGMVWAGKAILYRFCRAIIANSGRSAQSLAGMTGIPESRIDLVYNPVDTDALRALSQEEPDPAAWFPGGVPVVVAVGRLTRQKDFPSLLRAFKVARGEADCRLVILGEGGERANLEALVRELGLEDSVKLPGYRENPYPHIARASVFALSSAFEGLPNAMLEAVALGVPVASMDCPSGPREILSDGRGGRLVPASDYRALGEAIAELIRSPENARKLAEQATRDAVRFQPSHVGERYGIIIERVCGAV